MFVQVRLLKGFQEPLIYGVPSHAQEKACVGSFVRVPIRNKTSAAIVEKVFEQKPETSFVIKDLEDVEQFPSDACYQQFVAQLADYYQVDYLFFVKRVRQFLLSATDDVVARELLPSEMEPKKGAVLTQEQEAVFSFLKEYLVHPAFCPTVLHGVTGSGKTEIYKKLMEVAFAQRKTVLLLLPEVSLAVQFMVLLQNQLDPSIPLLSFHSATSQKEKKRLWQMLCAESPCVIIGVHLPILLPIAHLGLIIIDEEHDVGYQEKKHPKINTKEAALMRAKLAGIPILLGSATPSLTSLYNVKEKGWPFFQIKKRFSGNFPQVVLVELTNKMKKKRSFWISKELEDAIQDRLTKKEQILIFLNRRGYSFFVQCAACSFIITCANCSVSLTLHEDQQLTCHYCGYTLPMPKQCPGCKADESQLLKKGIGTQQLVSLLQKLFPNARIERADMDVTINKKKWQQTVRAFHDGAIDILVGTQTITKGYHFPRVTLVGVIWADLAIHTPLYNASEVALQQLIQVAGRAGRQHEKSLVIIQTMRENPLFEYLHEVDYLSYYQHESVHRKELRYPPFVRLVELELKHHDESVVDKEAKFLGTVLRKKIADHDLEVAVLGPAKPPVHKIKNFYARKMYLKSESMAHIALLFQTIDKRYFKSSLFFTPHPLS